MVDYKLIGTRLQQQRALQKLTQESVSERVGITTVYLSKIENGKVHPTLDTLSTICSVLHCDLGSLLSDTAPESRNYQNDRVVQLFHACSPKVKPIALDLLEQLSKLK